ncbi:cell division protein ZapE [Defluviimonas sp. WL0024]|uniref:Cell division protein ZapE n=1 Tax=Albidovulum salinarum TaxID=2984153 RepID=A0ABT2X3U9_9RHOB|nr:cell division protein ZapE [Defluviimonas sp. WL0024]MCU9848300.1 cell division protein ZapE [Defluviimonas sp. WL0024]
MSETLTEIYDRMTHSGALRQDAAQRALLPELQRIRAALESTTGRKKGLLAGLFAKPAEGVKGLYLWGGVGRGKSMLMDLFHENVAITAKRRVHFHAFMQEVQSRLHEVRKTGVDDAILPVAEEIAENLRLLSFDEMQITDIADAMIVGRLFQMLFDRGVTVVTTSNRVPDDLYKDGLNRPLFLPFIALLKTRMEVREIESETDYRQHRLEGAQVYFTPAGPEAAAAIARIWTELTGGGGDAELRLRIKGRDLVLKDYHAGVARASFWELCGRPLGPADFLALANAVRVLILDDIPHLSAENYNEAKRFVTLIDALYEAKVRLVASAADTPERLYVEGEGAFEFERTASRLREMQGRDWGLGRAAE